MAEVFQVKRSHHCSAPLLPMVTDSPLSLSDAVTEKNYILYDFSVTSVSTVFEERTVFVLFYDCFSSF